MSDRAGALGEPWTAVKAAARRVAGNDINRLIQHPPPPLILPQARLIVLFSPKSACTSVVIWFLHHLGEMQQAREYHDWPHNYRLDVYNKSHQYRDAISKNLRRFKVLRVIRDPFYRAVSSFRHVQRFGIADTEFAELLGRKDVSEAGVSFCEFLDLMEKMDLATCNEHYRIQRHPVEDAMPITYLINVSTDDLFARLNAIEAELGLPTTDFDRLDWLQLLHAERSNFRQTADGEEAYAQAITRKLARKGPWPAYKAFLTPHACKRIVSLYAADFAAYGLSTEAPPATEYRRPISPQWEAALKQWRAARRLKQGAQPAPEVKRDSARPLSRLSR